MKNKLIKKKFEHGDKIVPLPEADFVYPLAGSIFEVEHSLEAPEYEKQYSAATISFIEKDTYVHLWKTKDYTVRFKFGKKSFGVDSRYFRLMTDEDQADFMLDDL